MVIRTPGVNILKGRREKRQLYFFHGPCASDIFIMIVILFNRPKFNII